MTVSVIKLASLIKAACRNSSLATIFHHRQGWSWNFSCHLFDLCAGFSLSIRDIYWFMKLFLGFTQFILFLLHPLRHETFATDSLNVVCWMITRLGAQSIGCFGVKRFSPAIERKISTSTFYGWHLFNLFLLLSLSVAELWGSRRNPFHLLVNIHGNIT